MLPELTHFPRANCYLLAVIGSDPRTQSLREGQEQTISVEFSSVLGQQLLEHRTVTPFLLLAVATY